MEGCHPLALVSKSGFGMVCIGDLVWIGYALVYWKKANHEFALSQLPSRDFTQSGYWWLMKDRR
jgi:hypothetical protein